MVNGEESPRGTGGGTGSPVVADDGVGGRGEARALQGGRVVHLGGHEHHAPCDDEEASAGRNGLVGPGTRRKEPETLEREVLLRVADRGWWRHLFRLSSPEAHRSTIHSATWPVKGAFT